MANQCTACKVEFCAEDIVVCCEGFCENLPQFHAKCVGLTYDEGCACLHQNIFWMCDTCRVYIENGRFRNTKNEEKTNDFATKTDVTALKTEIERISQIVSEMSSNFTVPSETPPLPVNLDLTLHASPLSSTKFIAEDQTVSTPEETCLDLYVSNIAVDVPENEVAQMVCKSLGANEVLRVKRLVAAGKDISELDYVSYKITVDARFRNSATRRSIWPDGIRCREFKNSCRTAWRPKSRSIQGLAR